MNDLVLRDISAFDLENQVPIFSLNGIYTNHILGTKTPSRQANRFGILKLLIRLQQALSRFKVFAMCAV